MAVTLAKFRNAFSQFRKTDDGEIEAVLVLARLEVNTDVWGDRADSGIMYMTAHKLSLQAAGENAKLKPANAGKTVYLVEFNRMKRAVTSGFARAAGMPSANAFNDITNNERTFTR